MNDLNLLLISCLIIIITFANIFIIFTSCVFPKSISYKLGPFISYSRFIFFNNLKNLYFDISDLNDNISFIYPQGRPLTNSEPLNGIILKKIKISLSLDRFKTVNLTNNIYKICFAKDTSYCLTKRSSDYVVYWTKNPLDDDLIVAQTTETLFEYVLRFTNPQNYISRFVLNAQLSMSPIFIISGNEDPATFQLFDKI